MNRFFKTAVSTISLLSICGAEARAEATMSAIAAGAFTHAEYCKESMATVDDKDVGIPKKFKYLGIGGNQDCFRVFHTIDSNMVTGIQVRFSAPVPVSAAAQPPLASLIVLGGTFKGVPMDPKPLFLRFCFQNTQTKKIISENMDWDEIKKRKISFDPNWPMTYELIARAVDFQNPEISDPKNLVLTRVWLFLKPYPSMTPVSFGLIRINGEEVKNASLKIEGWQDFDPPKCCGL